MGRQSLVGRREDDVTATPREGLDGGLVTGHTGHDDVTGFGFGLLAHDHEVAVEDAGIDHGVATHPEHEERPGPGEVLGEGEELLHVLLGQHAGAGGHLAHQGHVTHRARLDDHLGGRVVADLDGPRLGRVSPQVALALEDGQVGVDGRGRGEPHHLADLADRRRVAAVPDRLGDAVEDLFSLGAQDLGHPASVRRCPPAEPPDGRGPGVANVRLRNGSGTGMPKANICSPDMLDTERAFVMG